MFCRTLEFPCLEQGLHDYFYCYLEIWQELLFESPQVFTNLSGAGKKSLKWIKESASLCIGWQTGSCGPKCWQRQAVGAGAERD